MSMSLAKLTEITTNWLMKSWYGFDSAAVKLNHNSTCTYLVRYE